MKLPLSRRRFLQTSAGLAAVGLPAAAIYSAARRAIPVGLVGAGARGRQLAGTLGWTRFRPVYGHLVAVCDVNRLRAEQVRREHCPWADIHGDHRELLARDDVQAVFIATPDHWHAAIALAALQAGKAVYCEKPLTLTIAEGQLLTAAANASNCTFQVGTQQRSDWRFRTACELVRNGRLGTLQRIDVKLPTSSLPSTSYGGPFPVSPAPEHLDWDRWLGQAPWAEFCKQRYDPFRWWFEYSGGFITDWGAHHLDVAHWAMDVEDSGPLTIDGWAELPGIENGYNTPRRFRLEMTYAGGVEVRLEPSETENGILFQGDEGRIFVNRGRLSGKPVDELALRPLASDAVRLGPIGTPWGTPTYIHVLDFLDCIETGRAPISGVSGQHRSATACHLANIALRLGRRLTWDASAEQVVGDAEANAMLSRPQREGYAVIADCSA
ncbi:MAG TPA: Gfo/Idh/MocA family oxidoreductase [Pirellulales bacterium]|nr:Gfo/Idh/MocA family oxidoreductase [Pirellulales bacterium]